MRNLFAFVLGFLLCLSLARAQTFSDGAPKSVVIVGGSLPNTVTSNQGTKGTIPQSWFVQNTDGTNALSKLLDLDNSGVTHEYSFGVSLRFQGNGGSVAAATNANPLRIDPTGTTSQPVKLQDGSGTAITSQASSAQRALDVGIDVSGVQVDPRSIRTLTSSDVVTANQGTANTAANAWPHKVTDGTNVQAVKAASTAAVATDPSSVVAFSPNSPLPTGANTIGVVNQGTANTAANAWPHKITDGVNTAAVKAASTAAAAADPAVVVAVSPNNTIPVNETQVGGASYTLGQKTMANSAPVTIASDQVAPKTYANVTASTVQSLVIGNSSAVSFSPPAGTVGFIAEAPSGNTQNLRCAAGTTATTTLGLRLEPGRDTGFVPVAATVSCIAEAGTNQEVDVQWVGQ